MHRTSPHQATRGAATLTLAATLLLLSSLVALYSQQRLWFEQRASSNQTQAIQAAELAQAGLEWAIAQLNTPTQLSAAPSCAPAQALAAGQQFRERYAEPRAATATTPRAVQPPPQAQAGCNLSSDGTLSCACPSPGQPLTLTSPKSGRFVVEFLARADDPLAIEVRSMGHSEGNDAAAQVRQVVKLAPAWVHPPDAAVVVGGHIQSTGTLHIVNQDAVNQGMALRAGGKISMDTSGASLTSPGLPPSAVLENDAKLQRLQAADASGERFFETFARRTRADFLNDPLTTAIDGSRCTTPAECGSLLLALHRNGAQQFWLNTPAELSTSHLPGPVLLGTQARPVIVASSALLSVAGDVRFHGLLLAGEMHVNHSGMDEASVTGALVVRGNLLHTGGALNVTFDRAALGMAGGVPMGLLTPVPGTWRDRLANY